MKKITKTYLGLLLLSLVFTAQTFAQGAGVGGGDLCRNEINQDRIALLKWILSGQASEINFNLAQVPGWSYDGPTPQRSYRKNMLSVLSSKKVVITCYLDPSRIDDPAARKISERYGVSYKSITHGRDHSPVTCVNYEDQNNISHIDCNYDLILNASTLRGNSDYRLIHHEFASIAGVEKRTTQGASDFSISNQLSKFEHWMNVKILGSLNQNWIRDGEPAVRLAREEQFAPAHWFTKKVPLKSDHFTYALEAKRDISQAIVGNGTCFLEGDSSIRSIPKGERLIIVATRDEHQLMWKPDSSIDASVSNMFKLVTANTAKSLQLYCHQHQMTVGDLKKALKDDFSLTVVE